MKSGFTRFNSFQSLTIATVLVVLSGCATFQKSNTAATNETSSSARASTPPGMNDKGEVIDSSKVEAGSGKHVKGVGDWEGEITGKMAAHSKFAKLKIGMSMKEVTDITGQPTDQGGYVTGKAWIPFYFGSDRNRYELVYKNEGRLIFAGGSMGDMGSGHLIWIINNAHEGKYR